MAKYKEFISLIEKYIKSKTRSCGVCNACCISLTIDEPNFFKPVHTSCKYLDNRRCSIYKKRPKTCKKFNCAWKQGWGHKIKDYPLNSGLFFHVLPDRTPVVSEFGQKIDSSRIEEMKKDMRVRYFVKNFKNQLETLL